MERRAVTPRIAVWAAGLPSFPSLKRHLDVAGVPFVTVPDRADAAGLADARNAEVMVVGGVTITRAHLEAFDRLRLIVRSGTGTDQIDMVTAGERGVIVTNTPEYATHEVADQALLLLLAAARRLALFSEQARGVWVEVRRKSVIRLHGSRLGIVGLGRIGSAMAARGHGLGMEVVAYDPYIDDGAFRRAGTTALSMDDLLATCDVISVHAPLTEETRAMFDRSAFDRMRRSPVLVNTARGPIVDTDALIAALDAGVVSAAGLDVIDGEQDIRGEHPLLDRDDVVVTPHIGWYSEGSLEQLGRTAAKLATDFVEHGIRPPALNPQPVAEH